MAAFLLVAFYAAMTLAACAVESAFDLLHLTPTAPTGSGGIRMGFAWDYTTWLNLVLLVPAAILVWRFMTTTGGPKMLRMMEQRERSGAAHAGR